MAITVTKADQIITVDAVTFTIYSQPGLGKTSLAFTANSPLLLDFDKGSYRAYGRKDVVQVSKWSDVAGMTAGDLADYETIIVDTVGKALEFLSTDIIEGNSALAYSGALNQRGWGQLGVRFGAFLRKLRSFGKDIILVSHMDEKADGDTIKERLKIPGGSKDLVLTDSDVIARIFIQQKNRHLVFSPTDTAFGKDPAGFGSMSLPDVSRPEFETCLADIIAKIKDGLNSLSSAQVERRSEVEWFDDNLPLMMDADAINAVLGRAKKVGRDVSLKVTKRAEELGLEFDQETRSYVYLEELDTSEKPDETLEAAE